jgi:hypothetical protein
LRYAYGFDGSIPACIAVEDGNRKWKGGRYGQEMVAFRLSLAHGRRAAQS